MSSSLLCIGSTATIYPSFSWVSIVGTCDFAQGFVQSPERFYRRIGPSRWVMPDLGASSKGWFDRARVQASMRPWAALQLTVHVRWGYRCSRRLSLESTVILRVQAVP